MVCVNKVLKTVYTPIASCVCSEDAIYTRAVWKVRELSAVRRCYAEGDGDCYAKL
jgi:hypothetical protein